MRWTVCTAWSFYRSTACPVATSDAEQTLTTPETIIVDGANGVTRAPRTHFPFAGWELGVALVAVALAFALRRRRAAVPLLLVLAALPGFTHVFFLRADAPTNRDELSEQVSSSMAEFARFVPWPSMPVTVVHEDDDVLFPLLRYARPTRPVAPGATPLEVRGASLRVQCSTLPGRIICGARR